MTEQLWSDEQLRAFLDEHLIPETMARLEDQLRRDDALRGRLADLARQRDQGAHTVGDIWRRYRLSCSTRDELGKYVANQLPSEQAGYINFHLQVIGCPVCRANLNDVQSAVSTAPEQQQRRRRLFESSAGRLPRTDRQE